MVKNAGIGFIGDSLFDEDEQRFRQEVRTFLRENPPPVGEPDDRDHVLRHLSWQRVLDDAGYSALHWPKQYGGAGLPVGHQMVALEELALSGYDHTLLLTALYLAGPLLFEFGTDQQRERHVDPIRRGEQLWCQLFSEPEAGSDLANVRTFGAVHGDRIVINGQKLWTSYAHHASWAILIFRTLPGSTRHKGISVAVLDMTLPDVELRRLRQMNGTAHFNEVFLSDVTIGLDDIVGSLHDGWQVVRALLGSERSGLNLTYYAEFIGRLMAQRDRGINPDVRAAYVHAWMGVALQRLTSLRAGSSSDRASLALASIGKLQMSTNSQLLTTLEMGAIGGRALAGPGDPWDAAVVDKFLAAPSRSIAGGTSEVQRNAIAEQLLGLPR